MSWRGDDGVTGAVFAACFLFKLAVAYKNIEMKRDKIYFRFQKRPRLDTEWKLDEHF